MSTEATACIEAVRCTLSRFAMIHPGDRVLVAVSGGPDSVCLAHVLHELDTPIEIAHFDHQTRNGESAGDADFVRELASRLGAPFHIERRPVAEEAAASSQSFEQYARAVRYAFLCGTAERRGCRVLATGHHAGDQVETVLMRLLRGTGPSGLAGIRPVRRAKALRVVRPLICCTGAQIHAYLDSRGFEFRTDRTNADTRHFRNRVRHELLPRLREEYNPRVDDALLRLAEVQRDEDDLLEREVDAIWPACVRPEGTIDRAAFGAQHRALQRRLLMRVAWRAHVDCPFERIDAARRFVAGGPAGRAFDLGSGMLLRNSRTVTEVTPRRTGDDGACDEAVPLTVPGETTALGKRFVARYLDRLPEHVAAYCTPARQVFDAATMGRDVVVRRRQPGDRFTPLGASGTKKIKDYLSGLALPSGERERQVLLVAGGRIAWVVGHAVAGHVAVSPSTRHILQIEVHDAPE